MSLGRASLWLLPPVAGLLASPSRALACAVCFGDPESSMAKGAVAGVLVLMGVIAFVLAGVAGTGLFWIQRSRRLGDGGPEAHARTPESHSDS